MPKRSLFHHQYEKSWSFLESRTDLSEKAIFERMKLMGKLLSACERELRASDLVDESFCLCATRLCSSIVSFAYDLASKKMDTYDIGSIIGTETFANVAQLSCEKQGWWPELYSLLGYVLQCTNDNELKGRVEVLMASLLLRAPNCKMAFNGKRPAWEFNENNIGKFFPLRDGK